MNFDTGREGTRQFGINVHRAPPEGERSTTVVNWSAGCPVLSNPSHFDYLIDLCEEAADRFGNGGTYTLLHQDDIERTQVRGGVPPTAEDTTAEDISRLESVTRRRW